MISFETLASSSAGNAYVVRSGSLPPLLIDAGIRYGDLQRAMNFKNHELAGCLLSHAHGDHSRCVPMLMANGTDVCASADTFEDLSDTRFRNTTRAKRIRAGQLFTIADAWTVMPFQAVHDCVGTLGFVVTDKTGDRLVWLSDTAYSKHRFEAINVLAIECNHSGEIMRKNVEEKVISADRYVRTTKNHMSLERVLEFLKANDLSKLREVHLLHLSDDNSDAPAFQLAVQRATGVPVYIAPK